MSATLNDRLITLKYALYARLGTFAVVLIVCSAGFAWFLEPSKALSVMAGALGVSAAVLKQRSDDSKASLDAFRDFNRRYQELEPALDAGAPAAKAKYVDLCAEEYWLYQQGVVPPPVWRSWSEGMRTRLAGMQDLREIVNKHRSSLYGFSFDVIEEPAQRARSQKGTN